MNKGMKRAVLYTRVSSEEQLDGHSLSAQEEMGRKYIQSRGWECVKVYEERGRSGKTVYRPEFQQMIKDAQLNRFDIIVVHKLDRFSRSLVDILVHLNNLNEHNVSFVSVSEDFDFTTPFGKVMLAVLGAFAEWYLDNLRTEIKKGKVERVRQGYWNGQLSFGYTTLTQIKSDLALLGEQFQSKKISQDEYSAKSALLEAALEENAEKPDNIAIPCPINAKAVQFAYEQYALGVYSFRDIAEQLTSMGYRINSRQRGLNIITKDTIDDLLENRFYIGETSYGRGKGKAKRTWMEGNHQPIIQPALFNLVQETRKRRVKNYIVNSPIKRVYPLSSVLVCLDCNVHFIGQMRSDRGSRQYRIPARDKGATCSQEFKSIDAEEIEEHVMEIISSFSLPANWVQRVEDGLVENKLKHLDLNTERQRIINEQNRLKTLFRYGDISEQEYLASREKLAQQLDQLPVEKETTMDDLKGAAQLLGNLKLLWLKATDKERKAIVGRLFNKIYILDGRIKAIEPTNIVWVLLRYVVREQHKLIRTPP